MRTLDYLKASGAGVLAMVLNIAASVPVIVAYRFFVIPGQQEAAYADLPQQIAPWSSHILGPVIFLALAWLFSRRRPRRYAATFAISMWMTYAVIDFAIASMAAGSEVVIRSVWLISLTLKLGAALAGAWLATRRPVHSE